MTQSAVVFAKELRLRRKRSLHQVSRPTRHPKRVVHPRRFPPTSVATTRRSHRRSVSPAAVRQVAACSLRSTRCRTKSFSGSEWPPASGLPMASSRRTTATTQSRAPAARPTDWPRRDLAMVQQLLHELTSGNSNVPALLCSVLLRPRFDSVRVRRSAGRKVKRPARGRRLSGVRPLDARRCPSFGHGQKDLGMPLPDEWSVGSCLRS